MGLKQKILSDMKKAITENNQKERQVTRMLLSEIEYAQSAMSGSQELDEKSVQKVIEAYYKQLNQNYSTSSDIERRSQLRAEINMVSRYLLSLSPNMNFRIPSAAMS